MSGFPVVEQNAAIRGAELATRVTDENSAPAYSWGGSFALASSPTDILTITPNLDARSIKIRRVWVQLFADSAATGVPVTIFQRSPNSGGTTANITLARRDQAQNGINAAVVRYTANPSSLGSANAVWDYQEAAVGTTASPAAPVLFDFTASGMRMPTLRSVSDGATQRIFAINLGGTSLPANPRAVVRIEAEDEAKRMVIILGDSLVSNDTGFRNAPGFYPGGQANVDVRFYGSNGKRLIDFLPTAEANTSGLTYGPATFMNSVPNYAVVDDQPDIVMHYGTNDVRQGLTSLDEMVARLDAFLHMLKYGTTSGGTFTSNYTTRSGTTYAPRTFTWNATLTAKPHCRVWMFVPNSYLADDPTSAGFISNSGFIAGANLAAAAQNATDMIWTAYQAFEGDPRLNGGGIIDSQTYVSPRTGYSFGRACPLAVNAPLMLDQLHPNYTLGGPHKYEQLAAVLDL